jgi:hypothetical protein
MHTHHFPAFRSRLAALGRRTAQRLRQATLAQLQTHLRDLLPAPLLSSEDEGPNSRERDFPLALTMSALSGNCSSPAPPAQFSDAISRAPNRQLRRQLWEGLLLTIARDQVPLRPNRTEPRAVKRRPKPYPLLNKPRRKFVEISHRSRYWKGRPRKYRGLN